MDLPYTISSTSSPRRMSIGFNARLSITRLLELRLKSAFLIAFPPSDWIKLFLRFSFQRFLFCSKQFASSTPPTSPMSLSDKSRFSSLQVLTDRGFIKKAIASSFSKFLARFKSFNFILKPNPVHRLLRPGFPRLH